MATLNLDSLLDCNSIRDFIGGESDTPANPSKTIFYQTSAPTSWVKETTHNNKCLRVIGGINGTALSPGGSSPFTTIFTNPISGGPYSTSSDTVPITINPATTDFSSVMSNQVTGSLSPATLAVAQLPSHTHGYQYSTQAPSSGHAVGPLSTSGRQFATPGTTLSTTNTTASHNHTVTAGHAHLFPLATFGHTHSISVDSTNHSHSFTTSQNFSIYYVDVIVAKKS